jgi:hypothetical protein
MVVRNWPNDFSEAAWTLAWVVVPLIGAALIALGILTTSERPGRAIVLVAVGSLMIAIVWFWLFMITVPVGLGVVALTYLRARHFGRPGPNNTIPTATA